FGDDRLRKIPVKRAYLIYTVYVRIAGARNRVPTQFALHRHIRLHGVGRLELRRECGNIGSQVWRDLVRRGAHQGSRWASHELAWVFRKQRGLCGHHDVESQMSFVQPILGRYLRYVSRRYLSVVQPRSSAYYKRVLAT